MAVGVTSQPSRGLLVGGDLGGAQGQLLGSEVGAGLMDRRPYEARLTLPQILVLWSVIGGTMIMVFLFGFYAGREQGVETALHSYSPTEAGTQDLSQSQGVRLPISGLGGNEPILPSSAADNSSNVAVGHGTVGQGTVGQGTAGQATGVAAQTVTAASIPTSDSLDPKDALTSGSLSPSALAKAGAQNAAGLEDTSKKRIDSEVGDTQVKTGATLADREALRTAKTESAPKSSAKSQDKPNERAVKSSEDSSGWSLQVAAAKTRAEAQVILKRLQKAKLGAKLEEAKVGDRTYYRVVMGPFKNRDRALAARKEVRASGLVKGDPFVKNPR